MHIYTYIHIYIYTDQVLYVRQRTLKDTIPTHIYINKYMTLKHHGPPHRVPLFSKAYTCTEDAHDS